MKKHIIVSALTLCTILMPMEQQIQLPSGTAIYNQLKNAGYATPAKKTYLPTILANRQANRLEIKRLISNAWERHNTISLSNTLTDFHVKDATKVVLETAIPMAKL